MLNILTVRSRAIGSGSWRPDSAEVDSHVAARARIALDTPDASFVGDVARYEEKAHVAWRSLGELIMEAGDGSAHGVEGDRDITFYKAAGVAAQDMGTAEAVYGTALRTGEGTVVDL